MDFAISFNLSVAKPGKVHDYDNNKYAVLHEIVHAYISVKNPNIHLWLTEGMALYLSNGEEFYKEYLEEMKIPTYEDTCTRNPIRFSNCGGYTFANTYIEYLESTYGWSKVLELIDEYSCAAEPPVRGGVSHLSRRNEPLVRLAAHVSNGLKSRIRPVVGRI